MHIQAPCDLTAFNSYRIAARCETAYFPDSAAEVAALLTGELRETPYVVLGSGHNVILARERYQTPFVIFNGNLNHLAVSGTRLIAGAGAFTRDVCELAAAHGLSGLEVFYDIPSSMGGAVVMNAGGHGREICDVLVHASYYDAATGRIVQAGNADLEFRYRGSLFLNDPTRIVLEVCFDLQPAAEAAIRERMAEIKAVRWEKQPRQFPNAGSVFKRPPGRFVGPMMDELGLKGVAVAGFRVSPKHGGFIERAGPGTGADLLCLIALIQERVQAAYGVGLEVEQRIIDVD